MYSTSIRCEDAIKLAIC